MSHFERNHERPRERLARKGAQSLTSAELLALVLRTGVRGHSAEQLAARLLARFASLDGIARAGQAELCSVEGIGPAKVASLRAAFEVGTRSLQTPLIPGEKLGSPDQVFEHFDSRLRRARQEIFFALLLDSRQRLICEVEVSRGSLNQSLVHPREVFAPAAACNAHSLSNSSDESCR